jgi:hypothetical protein
MAQVYVAAGSQQAERAIRIHTQKNTVERVAGPKYHPGRLLVRYKPGASVQAAQALHQSVKAAVVREFHIVFSSPVQMFRANGIGICVPCFCSQAPGPETRELSRVPVRRARVSPFRPEGSKREAEALALNLPAQVHAQHEPQPEAKPPEQRL